MAAAPPPDAVVGRLLARHGRTFAEDAGIALGRAGPSALFRLLCMSLLMSARIRWTTAVDASKALTDHGWTTARKLAASSWEERARTLNRAGYARYDERTATMLGDAADLLLDRYRGDLRRLRDEADGDVAALRRRLGDVKGMGPVGIDIFLREAQAAWPEVRPFVDDRALASASRLGLGRNVDALTRLVPERRFPALVAALVRSGLERDHGAVLDDARRARRAG